MIIRQTSLMDLHYDLNTDIMSVRWPVVDEINDSERGENYRLIRESISSYYINRFLLDAQLNTKVPDTENLRSAISQFFRSIADTGLRKLARVASQTDEREMRASRVFLETSHLGPKDLQFEIFRTEQEAVKWLLADQQN